MEDINKMTLGDIESQIEKQIAKVKKAMPATYRENAIYDRLQGLWDAVSKLQDGKDYILDDNFLDNLIENL